MPKCTVCHHPQHLEINQAILSKDLTLAALSQKYGLHPSSLQRHKNHIEVKMTRAHRRLREIREQGSLLVLNDLLEKVRRHIAAADAQGNYLAVFRGSHVASRLIHQMGRVEGDMQPDTLHRLISSPAWVPAGLLPTDPSLITGLHQGLVDGAFAPCPEPPPEVSAQAAGEADDLNSIDPFQETQNSELETGLATLRRFLPDLDLTLDDLPLLTGKLPKNERKISEKSAANTPPDTENNQQYKNVTPNEKNLPKNPECAPKTAASVDRESTRKGGEAQAPPPFLQPQSLRPHLEFPIILTSGCRETPTTNPGLSPSCRRPTPRLPARSLIPHLFSMIRMLLMPAFLRRSRRPALQPCSGNRKPTTEICLFPSVLNIPALGDLLPMTRGWCREPARTGPRRPWMPDFGKPGRYLVQQADR